MSLVNVVANHMCQRTEKLFRSAFQQMDLMKSYVVLVKVIRHIFCFKEQFFLWLLVNSWRLKSIIKIVARLSPSIFIHLKLLEELGWSLSLLSLGRSKETITLTQRFQPSRFVWEAPDFSNNIRLSRFHKYSPDIENFHH